MMKEATLRDWAIVSYPAVYGSIDNLKEVFAKFSEGQQVALYGRAVNDTRYQAETGEFEDGHRLITSLLVAVEGDRYYTENTCYILREETKNEDYKQWCND